LVGGQLLHIELLEIPRNLLQNFECGQSVFSKEVSAEGTGDGFIGFVDLLE
jgi:hypothetical protein